MKFEDFNLAPEIMEAIHRLGFDEPTKIQELCIPQALEGKDIVGLSETGSGKTAAFGLPILQKISKGRGIQALVLTPTRELCVQVRDSLAQFSKLKGLTVQAIFGGVGIEPQVSALRHADIVVGTPGRILDHLDRGTISFHHVQFLVLDEADKMFEMGFIEDVEEIIHHVPRERQTLLFSATMPSNVRHLIERHLYNPVTAKASMYVDKGLLKQVYYEVDSREKFSLLVHLLKNETPGLAMVFCGTRREVDLVSKNLKFQKVKALAIHGGLSQNKRLRTIDSLKRGDINVLVATDIAARGLDIKNVTHVYNYDVPKTPEEYVHRIGRTARAGANGDAITLLSDRDHDNFRRILADRTLDIQRGEVPEYQKVRFVVHTQPSRHSSGFHSQDRPRSGGFGGRSSGERRGYGGDRRSRDSAPPTYNRFGDRGKRN